MLICLWCLTASNCCQCSLLASFVADWHLHISILHYSMLGFTCMTDQGGVFGLNASSPDSVYAFYKQPCKSYSLKPPLCLAKVLSRFAHAELPCKRIRSGAYHALALQHLSPEMHLI